ncbi:MAG: cytochrome P450 [Ilumatobacteraceae bacterium]
MTLSTRQNGVAPQRMARDEIDLSSWEFWSLPGEVRDGALATLRAEAPISRQVAPAAAGFPSDGLEHWALMRFEDIRHVSRHPQLFSSSPSVAVAEGSPELAELFGSMIVLDDPRHVRLRAIVQKAFTPRVLAQVEGYVRDRARDLVEQMVRDHTDGTCDLVAALSAPLPLQVICDMMGIPDDDLERIFGWTNVLLGIGDPDVTTDFQTFIDATQSMAAYGMALAESRRSRARHDLTTELVQAEVDGERLSDAEIASFFILLTAAGNETTRNAISHGVVALTRHPDERATWWADFDGRTRTATEEIMRWASPVMYMRRRATEDTEIAGQRIAAGEKVTMWYASGNRDEAAFADPWRFDVLRDPNPQISFGAGGPHFCLGANLARREIAVTFAELHRQVPDIEATAEPSVLLSDILHGIKHLPVAWTPTSG